LHNYERQAVKTTSKLDLASAEARENRRTRQVLVSRPMSLDELPPSSRFNTIQRTAQVLQTQRTPMQRSLF
jgi:hypothetical protein